MNEETKTHLKAKLLKAQIILEELSKAFDSDDAHTKIDNDFTELATIINSGLTDDLATEIKAKEDLLRFSQNDPETGLPWGLKKVLLNEIEIRRFHPIGLRINYKRFHTKFMGKAYAIESKEQCLEAVKSLLDEVLPDWLPEPPRDPENPKQYL